MMRRNLQGRPLFFLVSLLCQQIDPSYPLHTNPTTPTWHLTLRQICITTPLAYPHSFLWLTSGLTKTLSYRDHCVTSSRS